MLAISDSAIGVHAIIYNSILTNISVLYISIAAQFCLDSRFINV